MSSEENDLFEERGGGGPESGGARFIDISPSEIFLNSSESLDRLTDHVANGGNLLDFAKLHRISYSLVRRFINSDPLHQKAYDEAVAMQDDVIQEKILRELSRIGNFDIRGIFDENNCVKRPVDWDDNAGSVISGFEVETRFEDDGDGGKIEVGFKYKVKLWDKTRTLDAAAKIKQMLKPKDRGSHDDDLAILNRMIAKNRLRLGPGASAMGIKPKADGASLDDGLGKPGARSAKVIDVTPVPVAAEVEEVFGEL